MRKKDNLTRFESIQIPTQKFLQPFPYLTNSRSEAKISSLTNLVNLTRTKNTSTIHSRMQSVDYTNTKNQSFGTTPNTNYFSTYSKKQFAQHSTTTSTLISDKSLKSFYDFKHIHRITDYTQTQFNHTKPLNRSSTKEMLKTMKKKIQSLLENSKQKHKDVQKRLVPLTQESSINFFAPMDGKKKFVKLFKKIELSGAHQYTDTLNQDVVVQLVALEQDLMNQNYNDFYEAYQVKLERQSFLEYLRTIIRSFQTESLQPNTLDDFEKFINNKWWLEQEQTPENETATTQEQKEIEIIQEPSEDHENQNPQIALIQFDQPQQEYMEAKNEEESLKPLERNESVKKQNQKRPTPAPTPKVNREKSPKKKKKSQENVLHVEDRKPRSRSSQAAQKSVNGSPRVRSPPRSDLKPFTEYIHQKYYQSLAPDDKELDFLERSPLDLNDHQDSQKIQLILPELDRIIIKLESQPDEKVEIQQQADDNETLKGIDDRQPQNLEVLNQRPQRKSYMKDMRKSIISSPLSINPKDFNRQPTISLQKTLESSQVFRRGVTMKHKSGIKPVVDESQFKALNEEAMNAEVFMENLLCCENIYDYDLGPHRLVSLDRFKPEVEQWIGDMDMMLKDQNLLNIVND